MYRGGMPLYARLGFGGSCFQSDFKIQHRQHHSKSDYFKIVVWKFSLSLHLSPSLSSGVESKKANPIYYAIVFVCVVVVAQAPAEPATAAVPQQNRKTGLFFEASLCVNEPMNVNRPEPSGHIANVFASSQIFLHNFFSPFFRFFSPSIRLFSRKSE